MFISELILEHILRVEKNYGNFWDIGRRALVGNPIKRPITLCAPGHYEWSCGGSRGKGLGCQWVGSLCLRETTYPINESTDVNFIE